MKIGLLECDDVVGRFPRVEGGYREMFSQLLPDFSFRYYRSYAGESPAQASECDAWMATGSKFAVYEGLAWVERLGAFLRDVKASRKPFVGICFGHQLLAHALGGEVARAKQGWGIGVLPVEIVKEEPWMTPPRRELRLQHSHQDQIQRLPPESVLLGRSPHCDVGLFRVGETMLGIEGHPEFTIPFGEALIRSRVERLGRPLADTALASLAGPSDGKLVGGWIAAFLRR